MKDRFSSQAAQYAAFRPTYPAELYEFICEKVKHFNFAWDAGTGNGQVAKDLAPKFAQILATDISEKQLQNAHRAANIKYAVAGEVTTSPDKSFDLITVAQAIHWFDREKFYTEVKRTLNDDGWLAVWGYGLLTINPQIDQAMKTFYTEIVGHYWDVERKLIDQHYQTIAFPFEEIATPTLTFSFQWTIEDLRGYLGTWSSVQKYKNAIQKSPVDDFIDSIRSLWEPENVKVTFPLFLRMGRT